MEILSLNALNLKNIPAFEAEAPQEGVFVLSDNRYEPVQLLAMLHSLLEGCDDESAKDLIGPQNSYAAISCIIEHNNNRYYVDRRMSSAGCTLTINGRYYPGKTPLFETLAGGSAHYISDNHAAFVKKFTEGLAPLPGAAEAFDYGEAENRLEELEAQLMSLNEELDKSRSRQNELLDLSSSFDAISREISSLDNQIRFEQAYLSEAANMNRLKDNMLYLQRIAQQSQVLNRYKKWLPDILKSYDQLKMRVESLHRIERKPEPVQTPQPEPVFLEEPMIQPELPEVFAYADEIDAMDPNAQDSAEAVMDHMTKVQLDRANDEVKNICSMYLEPGHTEDVTMDMVRSIDIDDLSDNICKYQDINEQLMQINGLLNFKTSNVKGPVIKIIFEILGIISILLALVYQFSAEIAGALPTLKGTIDFLIYYLNYVGIFAIHPPFMLLGIGALFIALAIISWIGKRNFVKKDLEQQNNTILEQSENIKNQIIECLHGLPLKSTYFDDINRMIESAVKDLQDIYQKQALLQGKAGIVTASGSSRAEELAALLTGQAADEKTSILTLKKLLEDARFELALAEQAAASRPEPVPVIPEPANAPTVQNISRELAAAMAEFEELESMLGANPRAEAERLNELTAGIKKAISIRDNIIKKTPNFKETAARLSAMSGKGWPYGEQEVSSSQNRYEQYLKNRNELVKRSAEIKNEIDRLTSLPSPVHIDANILEIQNRVETATVKHDMQMLAKSAMSPEDEAQTNKLHEISSAASKYIKILTQGAADSVNISPGGISAPGAQPETAYEAAYLAIVEAEDTDIPLILSGAQYSQNSGLVVAKAIAAKRQTIVLK